VRTKLGIHAVVLAIVAIGLLAFGSTAMANGKQQRTLRLVATQNQSEFLDLGTPGPSLGDELIISETLSRRGHEVGESGVVCTVTEVTPPYAVLTLHCVATLSLRKGQITLQGLIEVQGETDMGPFVVAITGGTGAFRGAGGEATVRGVSETMSIYKLRFDSPNSHHKKNKKKKHHG
jgi:hypothetical protein